MIASFFAPFLFAAMMPVKPDPDDSAKFKALFFAAAPANPTAGIESHRDLQGGKSQVYGRLLRKTGLGEEPVAATAIYVVPANDYTAWMVGQITNNGVGDTNYPVNTDLRKHFVERSQTGYDGRFAFDYLIPGSYFAFGTLVVTYGDAQPYAPVRSGLDANGRTVNVYKPGVDMRKADQESYAWVYSFTIGKTIGDYDIGDMPETDYHATIPDRTEPPATDGNSTFVTYSDMFIPHPVTPSAAELRPFAAAGSGTVSGRLLADFEKSGGQRAYHGYHVFLVPATQWGYTWAYSLGRYADRAGNPIVPWEPWADKFVRTADSDVNGNFTFTNVPPGKYVVGSYIEADFTGGGSYTTTSTSLQFGVTGYNWNPGPYEDYGPTYGYNTITTTTPQTYSYHCRIIGALGAVLDVPAGAVQTPANLAILGDTSDGSCPPSV